MKCFCFKKVTVIWIQEECQTVKRFQIPSGAKYSLDYQSLFEKGARAPPRERRKSSLGEIPS